MSTKLDPPTPFLDVVVQEFDLDPALTGLCAGYENGAWRCQQFATHLIEWLPEFALTRSELEQASSGNFVRLLRRAAAAVYQTDKYRKRGEFGELILHAVIRQVFATTPAINKIYFKDAANDTVKGFDAVHVVSQDRDLELWLGEAKFYSDATQAISAVSKELADHTDRDYLRDEFLFISNKIDPSWDHAPTLSRLLDPNTSLDDVFTRCVFPILLTYDSDTVASHRRHSDDYAQAIRQEFLAHHDRFRGSGLPSLRIYLLLLPLDTKQALVDQLHQRLEAAQNL